MPMMPQSGKAKQGESAEPSALCPRSSLVARRAAHRRGAGPRQGHEELPRLPPRISARGRLPTRRGRLYLAAGRRCRSWGERGTEVQRGKGRGDAARPARAIAAPPPGPAELSRGSSGRPGLSSSARSARGPAPRARGDCDAHGAPRAPEGVPRRVPRGRRARLAGDNRNVTSVNIKYVL